MRPRRSTEFEWRKKGISKDGAEFVEFALVAPVFLMLLFGIIEFSRVMLMYHHVGNAARDGSRYAIVHGSTSLVSNATAADVENYVRSKSPVDPNNVLVTTEWQNPNPVDHKPGTWVKVQVRYNFNFILPIWSGIQLTSTSRMVISY